MKTEDWAAPWLIGLTLIASPGPHAASLPDGTYALHAEGFGPVRAGMTVAEAARVLGDALVPDGPEPGPEADPETAAEYDACHYASARRFPGIAFMIAAGRIARVDVSSEPYRTFEGAGIGTPEVAVRRFYPAAVTEPHPYADFAHALVVQAGPGHALLFETDGESVTAFRAGAREAVARMEGCL